MNQPTYTLEQLEQAVKEFVALQNIRQDSWFVSDKEIAHDFLGRFIEHIKPTPPKPKTPYRAVDCQVFDADGYEVANTASSDQAQSIADAVNKVHAP